MIKIGKNCRIHPTALINPDGDISIGDNVLIGAYSLIGFDREDLPVKIENNVVLDARSTLYGGVNLKQGAKIRNGVFIRENTVIGEKTSIGTYTCIEGNTTIGSLVSIFSQCHITQFSQIDNEVFIAPFFSPTNDPRMAYRRFKPEEKGVTIRKGVRIGISVSTLPGITIGKNAFIAARAMLTRDVEENAIMRGFPAKKVGEVPPEERL